MGNARGEVEHPELLRLRARLEEIAAEAEPGKGICLTRALLLGYSWRGNRGCHGRSYARFLCAWIIDSRGQRRRGRVQRTRPLLCCSRAGCLFAARAIEVELNHEVAAVRRGVTRERAVVVGGRERPV